MNEHILSWLLQEDNPGVRVRTLTGLVQLPRDHEKVRKARRLVLDALPTARDLSWMDLKGQVLVYNLTALAESGLSREDVSIEAVASILLSQPFDANCGDLMALRAMVMLGYGRDPRVERRLEQLRDAQRPDGAWLCLHRVEKMHREPKSCIRAAMHGLLLAGELRKQGLCLEGSQQLVDYFLRRRLFYRTDDPAKLVLPDHPGKRMVDSFFPSEYFRVGLPLLLDALAVLGVGQSPALHEAWILLEGKKDEHGRIPLEGTLPRNKSYLARERVGQPSKWGTLYAYLAWNSRGEGGAASLPQSTAA